MTEELERQLTEKYPNVFVTRRKGDHFYFECGDGWYNIIDSLARVIQGHTEHLKSTGHDISDWSAVQVKEKFGTLRFYVAGYDDYVQGAITMAEAQSGYTCEYCGNVGTRISGGWVQTLCTVCHTSQEEIKKKRAAELDKKINNL